MLKQMNINAKDRSNLDADTTNQLLMQIAEDMLEYERLYLLASSDEEKLEIASKHRLLTDLLQEGIAYLEEFNPYENPFRW